MFGSNEYRSLENTTETIFTY